MTTNFDVGIYQQLLTETIREFENITKVSFAQRAKDAVKSAMGRSVRVKDPMFWPAGMLMLGLAEAESAIVSGLCGENGEEGSGVSEENNTTITSDQANSLNPGAEGAALITSIDGATLIPSIEGAIKRHLSLWKHRYGARIDYIDDSLAGAALIRLYSVTEDEELKSMCRDAADVIYGSLAKSPVDPAGTPIYNSDKSTANVFADGVGMAAMFLSLYAKTFGNRGALELAELMLENFRKYGMDERSGLPYHGYALSLTSGEGPAEKNAGSSEIAAEKKGVLSWGRAAGWLMMGLSEFASANEGSLSEWYADLSDLLLSYQRKDGGYSWQIQAAEGPLDTSATGMVIYSLACCAGRSCNYNTGATQKDDHILFAAGDDNLSQTFDTAASVMFAHIEGGKAFGALSSCDDFGVHYQTYGHYPWGQGAVLAALSRLARA